MLGITSPIKLPGFSFGGRSPPGGKPAEDPKAPPAGGADAEPDGQLLASFALPLVDVEKKAFAMVSRAVSRRRLAEVPKVTVLLDAPATAVAAAAAPAEAGKEGGKKDDVAAASAVAVLRKITLLGCFVTSEGAAAAAAVAAEGGKAAGAADSGAKGADKGDKGAGGRGDKGGDKTPAGGGSSSGGGGGGGGGGDPPSPTTRTLAVERIKVSIAGAPAAAGAYYLTVDGPAVAPTRVDAAQGNDLSFSATGSVVITLPTPTPAPAPTSTSTSTSSSAAAGEHVRVSVQRVDATALCDVETEATAPGHHKTSQDKNDVYFKFAFGDRWKGKTAVQINAGDRAMYDFTRGGAYHQDAANVEWVTTVKDLLSGAFSLSAYDHNETHLHREIGHAVAKIALRSLPENEAMDAVETVTLTVDLQHSATGGVKEKERRKEVATAGKVVITLQVVRTAAPPPAAPPLRVRVFKKGTAAAAGGGGAAAAATHDGDRLVGTVSVPLADVDDKVTADVRAALAAAAGLEAAKPAAAATTTTAATAAAAAAAVRPTKVTVRFEARRGDATDALTLANCVLTPAPAPATAPAPASAPAPGGQAPAGAGKGGAAEAGTRGAAAAAPQAAPASSTTAAAAPAAAPAVAVAEKEKEKAKDKPLPRILDVSKVQKAATDLLTRMLDAVAVKVRYVARLEAPNAVIHTAGGAFDMHLHPSPPPHPSLKGKRPDQRKAREELRRRAKAVYLALDQQSHDASAMGRVDYDEWRQGLRAMRVDVSGLDMALLFANYADDGVGLDYALWLERLGLGRPELDLLAILKSSLKGLLETEPNAQVRPYLAPYLAPYLMLEHTCCATGCPTRRYAFGPPGISSRMWRVPHIQARQPPLCATRAGQRRGVL